MNSHDGRKPTLARRRPRAPGGRIHDLAERIRLQQSGGLCCKPDVGVSQIRTTTVLSSCFCVGQTVL